MFEPVPSEPSLDELVDRADNALAATTADGAPPPRSMPRPTVTVIEDSKGIGLFEAVLIAIGFMAAATALVSWFVNGVHG